ncbi:MAG: ATP-binding cassette domain-containing protein, partial [Flavobacteriales bacterium]
KRYGSEWILRNISTEFHINESYAILGDNGSGKSSLLKLISGFLEPTEGNVFIYNNDYINIENYYEYISMATPSIQFDLDLTLEEFLTIHFELKGYKKNNRKKLKEFIDKVGFENDLKKLLKYFSSGMKQRLKLGTSLLDDTYILLLDEPLMHLDKNGIALYDSLLKEAKKDKIILIFSNYRKEEYVHCNNILYINDRKLTVD